MKNMQVAILTGTEKNTEVRALSYRLKNCLAQCGLDQI